MYDFTHKETEKCLHCDFALVSPDKPRDIEDFQTCIRDEYGDTYPMKNIYDPQAFSQDLSHGRLHAFLARESATGDPVASLALTPSKGLVASPELTMHVVRREYRGYGIGTVLTRALLALPTVKLYCSVTAHSVTFHPKAQHQTLSCAMTPTGFMFLVHSNSILKHSYGVDGVPKQSFAVSVFAESKTDAGQLFLPPEHRDFIEDIYRRLGVSFTVAAGNGPDKKSQMSMENDPLHHSTTVLVTRCGEDVLRQAKERMSLPNAPDQTFNVLLNLNSPGALWLYRRLEELGFLFAGLQPLCKNGEFLIMHNPMSMQIPFDRLYIDEGYRRIYDYIRRCCE